MTEVQSEQGKSNARPRGWGGATTAWDEDEFLYVDDKACVYTVRLSGRSIEERVEARIPGKGVRTVEQLRAEGCRIVMPRRLRPEPASLWRGRRLLPEMR
jgi:hypothetical protein